VGLRLMAPGRILREERSRLEDVGSGYWTLPLK